MIALFMALPGRIQKAGDYPSIGKTPAIMFITDSCTFAALEHEGEHQHNARVDADGKEQCAGGHGGGAG